MHLKFFSDSIWSWWRHQMETFSALLTICAGNSPVPGEFPAQRPVTRSFDVFFDLRPNKRLSKQSWGWWFETLSRPLWRHRNVLHLFHTRPIGTAFRWVKCSTEFWSKTWPCFTYPFHYLRGCPARFNFTKYRSGLKPNISFILNLVCEIYRHI